MKNNWFACLALQYKGNVYRIRNISIKTLVVMSIINAIGLNNLFYLLLLHEVHLGKYLHTFGNEIYEKLC